MLRLRRWATGCSASTCVARDQERWNGMMSLCEDGEQHDAGSPLAVRSRRAKWRLSDDHGASPRCAARAGVARKRRDRLRADGGGVASGTTTAPAQSCLGLKGALPLADLVAQFQSRSFRTRRCRPSSTDSRGW